MPATVFAGNKVKTLKSTLNLNGGADIISTTSDPTVTPVDAAAGSIILNSNNGKIYKKTDNGSSTNSVELSVATQVVNSNVQNTFTNAHDVSSSVQIPNSQDQVVYVKRQKYINRIVQGGLGEDYTSIAYSSLYDRLVIVNQTNNNVLYGNAVNFLSSGASGVSGTNQWKKVCWSPDLKMFVSVGFGNAGAGSVMYSYTGLQNSWSLASSGFSGKSWSSVCWSSKQNKFVAVAANAGLSAKSMTSTDGQTWSISSNSVPVGLLDVCYSEDKDMFVAVGTPTSASESYFYYSSDGQSWTKGVIASQHLNNNRPVTCVTYSKELGYFVAGGPSFYDSGVGAYKNTLFISGNGIDWAPASGWNVALASPSDAYNIISVSYSEFVKGVICYSYQTSASENKRFYIWYGFQSSNSLGNGYDFYDSPAIYLSPSSTYNVGIVNESIGTFEGYTDGENTRIFLNGSIGSVESGKTNGQKLTIIGTSNFNSITLTKPIFSPILSFNNLQFNKRILGKGDVATFVWTSESTTADGSVTTGKWMLT